MYVSGELRHNYSASLISAHPIRLVKYLEQLSNGIFLTGVDWGRFGTVIFYGYLVECDSLADALYYRQVWYIVIFYGYLVECDSLADAIYYRQVWYIVMFYGYLVEYY